MTTTLVRVEPIDSGVQTIILDNPPVNAVNVTMMGQLADAFVGLSFAKATVALLMGQTLRPFCAGADMKEELDSPGHHRRGRLWRSVLSAMRQSPIPIIAAVDGPCVGLGMGLITHCDLVIASEGASFGLPEINVGRAGGAANLRRFVPERIVRRMVLTGDRISASEALDAHLIDEVVPMAEWQSRPLALARSIAGKGDRVIRIGKRSLDESEFLAFEEGSALEAKYADQLRNEGFWESLT